MIMICLFFKLKTAYDMRISDWSSDVGSSDLGEKDVELRPLDLLDFEHLPVLGLYCRQHVQLMRLDTTLRRAGVDVFEADIRPPERYLMERFITAPVWFGGAKVYDGMLLDAQMNKALDYRTALPLVSVSIATTAQGDLYTIDRVGCG